MLYYLVLINTKIYITTLNYLAQYNNNNNNNIVIIFMESHSFSRNNSNNNAIIRLKINLHA